MRRRGIDLSRAARYNIGMKSHRFLPKIAAAAVLCAVLCSLFAGCSDIRDIYTIDSTDYGLYANYHYSDGSNKMNFSLRGEGGEWVEVSWDTPVTFNTLLIEESGSHVTEFEIYIGDSLVYSQDEIGDLRLVYLGTVNTTSIRISVKSSDGAYNLTRLGVYYVPRNRDFAITDMYYVDPDSDDYLNDESDFSALAMSTDVILTGEPFAYGADGSISADVSKLAAAVTALKRINPGISVHVLLYAKPETDGLSAAEVRENAMGDNRVAFGKSVVELLSLSGADGAIFDFVENPSVFSHGVFNDFIEFVRGLIPSPRQLGVYVSHDNATFDDASKSYIDDFYVVAFGMGDYSTNPASFASVCQVLEKLSDNGVPKAKVQLTIPLFGKALGTEENSAERETVYRYRDNDRWLELGYYDNSLTENGLTLSFNGYTMIKDKTAFAYGYGMSGVVLVDYDSDVSYSEALSLHRAVHAAIDNRN